MKNKVLSVLLAGTFIVGATGQRVRTNAFCTESYYEINKPFELNCNIRTSEVAAGRMCYNSTKLF